MEVPIEPRHLSFYANQLHRALFAETFDEDIRAEAAFRIYELLDEIWHDRSIRRRAHWTTPDCESIGQDVVEYVLGRFHPEADHTFISKNLDRYMLAKKKERPLPPGCDPVDAEQELDGLTQVILTETAVADHCIMAVRNYPANYGKTPMPNVDFFANLSVELLFMVLRRHRPDLVNPRKL